MRRLFQFGTVLLLLVTLVTPILEYFDRWDTAGLSNDTEFRLFSIVLLLCLVLIVVRLIARFTALVTLTIQGEAPPSAFTAVQMLGEALQQFAFSPASPPLRI